MSIATQPQSPRQLTPVQQKHQGLRAFLNSPGMKANLSQALPKHMTADRMVRMALTAASRNPKLLDCTMESVALALLTASQLGLEVNGRDAHLVPYKDTCQLIPDYKGLIQLGYRSGMVDNISAKAVYEKDFFDYELGSNEHLKHVPCADDEPGNLIYAWAMVHFRSGGSKFVVLNRRDINRRKTKSQTASRSDSPWSLYPEAMWAKSAVKELSKWMPQVPELQTFHDAVDADNAAERGAAPAIIDIGNQGPPPSRTSQLASQLAGDRAAAQQHEPTPPEEAADPPPPTEPGADAATRAKALATIEGRINDALTADALDAIDTADPDLLPADTLILDKIKAERRAEITKPAGKTGRKLPGM